MAKSRRYGSDRRERFLGSFNQQNDSDESELSEEEVWSMIDGRDDRTNYVSSFRGTKTNNDPSLQNHQSENHDRPQGGLSLAFTEANNTQSSTIVHQYRRQDSMSSPHHMAQSAPMNVPNWAKILRVESVESIHDSSDDYTYDHDSEKMPPHEYLQREYERDRNHKMAATSVLEGVGRTLKGRDMSRVRDAVWNQTGFYG